MRRLILLVLVLALAGCENPVGLKDGGWTYSSGTDKVSGQPWAQAVLDDDTSRYELVIQCAEGVFRVYVTTFFITQDGSVRYRLDEQTQRVQTWSEATSFKGLFYRGDARAFAKELVTAKKMVFEAREYLGNPFVGTFTLEGLNYDLPKIEAACG